MIVDLSRGPCIKMVIIFPDIEKESIAPITIYNKEVKGIRMVLQFVT